MAEPPFLQALIKSANFYGRFAPSFTRVGYVARGLPFKPVRADYTGQIWLVTGATGGLGRAAALKGVRKGATVYAVGRNVAALDSLKAGTASEKGTIIPCRSSARFLPRSCATKPRARTPSTGSPRTGRPK